MKDGKKAYLSINGSAWQNNGGECHKGNACGFNLAFCQCVDGGKLTGNQTGVNRLCKGACQIGNNSNCQLDVETKPSMTVFCVN